MARLRSPEGKAAVCAREGDSSREAASCRCRGAECARAALLLPVVVAAVHAERRVAIDAVRLGSRREVRVRVRVRVRARIRAWASTFAHVSTIT